MTDGGGIFVALTSCRDEERAEEFLTWYEEVQFRNALAVDGRRRRSDALPKHGTWRAGISGYLLADR
jgi:hypothetical protein